MDIAEICSIIIATCALILSCYTAYLQREHNQKTVTPICAIIEKYHERNIAVLIVNRGVGIMIVDDISVSKNNITINNLIMHMPYVNQRWKGFSLEIKGRTILPNDCIILCAIDAKSEKNRKKVLEALDGIEISIQFHDIYDNEYKCTKVLNSKFFSSHFKYRAE